jgi:hypothetical protein
MNERLYEFAPNPVWGNLIALTRDKEGRNLPPDGAPWRHVGTLGFGAEQGPGIRVSWKRAIAAVAKDGYFIWPVRNPRAKKRGPILQKDPARTA